MNDATPPFTVEPAEGVHIVRAGGAVIAEAPDAPILRERGLEPVVDLPRGDIGMAFLERSEIRTRCPHRGEATSWQVIAKSGPIEDAGWSQEDPVPGAEGIRGHLAVAHDRVAVERL